MAFSINKIYVIILSTTMSTTKSPLLTPVTTPTIPSNPTVPNAALSPMGQLQDEILQLQTMQNKKMTLKNSFSQIKTKKRHLTAIIIDRAKRDLELK